jgi:hypothetical protein
MNTIIDRLAALSAQHDRFIFDVRGECLVYSGIVGAYRATDFSEHFTDLPLAVAHALANDGIVGAWKNDDGRNCYDSCRLFTDHDHAIRFAREQGQRSVYNLNRDQEIIVSSGILAA